MRLSNKIVLASLNLDKFEEFKEIFSAYPEVELAFARDHLRNAEKLDYVEIYDSYLENAAAKARVANQGCHYPCLADDSGLEVEALGGAPGVHSRRFAKAPQGTAPFSKLEQDRANIDKLLTELKGKTGEARKARFVTTLALNIEGILVHATGTLEGTIIESPRGANGFGYDPIFVPEGSDKTLAEMTDVEKNSLSHRGRAVHALMAQIKEKGIILAKP